MTRVVVGLTLMAGKYLLDTNVVVALFGGDPGVGSKVGAAAEIFLPVVALGELFFGAANSGRPEANTARSDDFSAACTLVRVDAGTARVYGRVKRELRRKGKPIPENDLWIAASALQHSLMLVTRDRHFGNVDGLATEAW